MKRGKGKGKLFHDVMRPYPQRPAAASCFLCGVVLVYDTPVRQQLRVNAVVPVQSTYSIGEQVTG